MSELCAFFLVGPTASGKTDVSQWIAEKYSFDILSADAMMVYRGMDIGTAKPAKSLRGRVRYWGLDLAALGEHFSAGMYGQHAIPALRQAAASGRKMIVAGGTGLYIKALTHGLSRLPPGSAALRSRAEAVLKDGGLAALQQWVQAQVPEGYASLADQKNPRRLVRLLEVAGKTSGVQPAVWRRAGKGGKLAGLLLSREDLVNRIMTRVRAMYAGGLLEEVAALMRQGLETAPTAGKAIGYAEAMEVLRGRLTLAAAVETTAVRTRQLAKRQMTWFRNQADVEWIRIESGMPLEQIGKLVMACWEKSGPTMIADHL